MNWRIFHKGETDSTNRDARAGRPGDVFTADFQTAGRGRLDHKWLSRPGENLMMSAVVDVAGLAPDHAATLPLVVGLSVVEALESLLAGTKDNRQSTDDSPGHQPPNDLTTQRPNDPLIKWPNDVLVGGRKLAGILCERVGDAVIAGVGVNVRQREFPSEIADRATSLSLLHSAGSVPTVAEVRDAVLTRLDANVAAWRAGGFASLLPRIAAVDCLKGREVAVRRTDADAAPACGLCGGIASDGSLIVAGERVYAGEAHVC